MERFCACSNLIENSWTFYRGNGKGMLARNYETVQLNLKISG